MSGNILAKNKYDPNSKSLEFPGMVGYDRQHMAQTRVYQDFAYTLTENVKYTVVC